MARTISDEDIEAIARRTAQLTFELLRAAPAMPADSDPWFTRKQVAAYLNCSVRTFCELRNEHAEALKPCSDHPLRWSRNALDAFKFSRGGLVKKRPGRKCKGAIYP